MTLKKNQLYFTTIHIDKCILSNSLNDLNISFIRFCASKPHKKGMLKKELKKERHIIWWRKRNVSDWL